MRTISLLAIIVVSALSALGQKNYVEVRAATPYYQYEEYGRELPNDLAVDFVHIGTTGQHQVFAGVAKRFHPAKKLTVTPWIYGAFGSHGQKGVQAALSVWVTGEKWKANIFVGKYIRIKGDVKSYTVMDTADVTHSINKKIDVGVQTGFFRQEEQWNPQSGPMIRFNDSKGAWAVSYRFGHANELRVIRTFSF